MTPSPLRSIILTLAIITCCVQAKEAPKVDITPMPADNSLTALEIIEKNIAYEGGREKFNAITSMYSIGRVNINNGDIKGRATVYHKRPCKMMVSTILRGVGTIASGYNGDIGWESMPEEGVTHIVGDELADMARDSHINILLDAETTYASIELLGIGKVGKVETYAVQLTPKDSKTVEIGYFKTRNAELLRVDFLIDGKVDSAIYLSSYRRAGGIRFPHSISSYSKDGLATIILDKIEINKAIDDSVFDPPAKK